MNAIYRAASGDASPYGARDAGIISLLFDLGLRDVDVIALQVQNYDCTTGNLAFGHPSYEGRILKLTPTARASLDRWLVCRGSCPGPLFNPIQRPGRIVIKALNRASVNYVLDRRARGAGVESLTADDVFRSRSLLAGGQWHGPWHSISERCYPFSCQILRAQGARALRAGAFRPDPSEAVIRFVSHHTGARRSGLLERLDHWAELLSDGRQRALTFNWRELRADQLPSPAGLLERFALRHINKMIDALCGLLKEGVLTGQISPEVCASVKEYYRRPAKQPLPNGRRLAVSDVGCLMEVCLSDPSPAGVRDAVLVGLLWERATTISQAVTFPWAADSRTPKCIHNEAEAGGACLHPRFQDALKEWSRYRPYNCRELLLMTNQRGEVLPVPLTARAATGAIKQRSERAGMGAVSPDDLRSSSIVHALLRRRWPLR
jgi:integrase/recombinase XerD